MKKLLLLLLLPLAVYAQDTTINYKGQPPPSAIAPAVSGMVQDVCAVPVSGAVSGALFGVSGGTVLTDGNCERIKLARELANQGLKVAAVSLLCQDERVWEAMEMSGSSCPFGGAIGDAARAAWTEKTPKRFEKLYGKVPAVSTAIPN